MKKTFAVTTARRCQTRQNSQRVFLEGKLAYMAIWQLKQHAGCPKAQFFRG
jgi:hypothetical protein